ncbi:hypothetical protein CC1G_03647 [Coprinopsis cinerea okayama7|uniref:Rho-GAP domain-containing protein n=1 Tax=Coprinopsis cinerea (strain Okayama-7 / 130 / ATCC MYA-4618 / FGSC 9003) TaxID=240176 RepID=A8N1V4_COPC7|nr:hypothetical protein CC1G_03647 [Coprinopsis cinerea okayama7\|eukprot:XP_001828853.2 hypothetical protein CC1G_03647 [Coprinopsis cinerea okayama7\
MLPRLKNRYTKKFSEVEEEKRSNALPPLTPAQSPPDSNINPHSRSNPNLPSRPVVTGPQPLRALDRRPSASAPRNRSPSSSGALSDLAHHGKKHINQLIGGFLEKGGVKETLSGVREHQALRTVRAKREADEADKEYRKGVHWLETLRLRRTKILESGYKVSSDACHFIISARTPPQSLEMFVEESATAVKKVLERYTDHLTATYSTQSHLCAHARTYVDRISPERDLVKLKANIPRSLASAIPEPILYEHGQVGECNDLIFGFSLVDYATAKGLGEREIPKIVRLCIEEIDRRGLDSEGIYRVSGRHAVVQALQHDIEKDESEFQFTPKDDIYAVASLLKLYLRELPEPLFKFSWQDRVQHTLDRAEHVANNFMLLRSKIRRLPSVHQATLRALIEHLSRVVARSEKNKMDPKNVAIVFGGVIFGDGDEMPKGGDLLSMQSVKDTVMEDLIIHVNKIFGDNEQSGGPYSPPLPPTPATEAPIPQYYGSKSTKVASVPPGNNHPGSPQDFTPRLPPRPTNSIHPSARNAGSPIKPRADPLPIPIQRDMSIDEFSIPPSPSDISTSLDTDEDIALHTRETTSSSTGTESGEKKRSTPPSPQKYPFPSTQTPGSTPSKNRTELPGNTSPKDTDPFR